MFAWSNLCIYIIVKFDGNKLGKMRFEADEKHSELSLPFPVNFKFETFISAVIAGGIWGLCIMNNKYPQSSK